MQIAVISDIHLGSGGPTDLFGHDDADFLRFLRFLEGQFERIVLLGDIWETLTTCSFGQAESELRRAQAFHKEIHARFLDPKYSYVFGNHDHVAERLDGAKSELKLEVDGVRLFFGHGHYGDPLCQKAKFVSELGVWLGGWLRRLGLGAIYSYFAELEHLRSAPKGASCAVREWAIQKAGQLGADVVVTGHTHQSIRAETDNCLFLNSGSCSGGEISFLSLDTKRGDYHIHHTY